MLPMYHERKIKFIYSERQGWKKYLFYGNLVHRTSNFLLSPQHRYTTFNIRYGKIALFDVCQSWAKKSTRMYTKLKSKPRIAHLVLKLNEWLSTSVTETHDNQHPIITIINAVFRQVVNHCDQPNWITWTDSN